MATTADNAPEGLGRSASTPALPPLAGSPAALAARGRGRKPGTEDRQEFLNGLLNEDLQKLTQWHGTRPHHEQKRFLRSVDTLYKAFKQAEEGPRKAKGPDPQQAAMMAQEAAMANAAAMARAAEEDPLSGPPRTPRALAPAASEPGLVPAQPIEVFEQKKRRGRRGPGGEDPNSLQDWLEGFSQTSASTGTTAYSQGTRFSELTLTSLASSVCSDPGTMNQMHYRHHKRAFACNRATRVTQDNTAAGNLKDGVPNFGFPDSERFTTAFRDQFGTRPVGANITKQMYASVFQDNQHPFVARFLEVASPEQRDQFSGMVRSLEYLRTQKQKETTSVLKQELNLEENSRLWKPPRQKAVFDTSEINLSQVPLGTLTKGQKKKVPPPEEPPPPLPPPSPSVSGLGSLPLTRMSTPLLATDVP